MYKQAEDNMKKASVAVSVNHGSLKTTIKDDEQSKAFSQQLKRANEYIGFVKKCRESGKITNILKEAEPYLRVELDELDRDPYLLCTPEGTYDLRQGVHGKKDNDPSDMMTHSTICGTSDEGAELWQDMLNKTFNSDTETIEYVQKVVGEMLFGRVFQERLIIAYGDGRNGKSTFWNTIKAVFGSYSGTLSSDALTLECRRNVKPEMAQARGKRLLIAGELEQNKTLSTSFIKQMTSTDPISAEKKYKDPMSFIPSHSLVLYTNHLPKVSAVDNGIWRRLHIIPFTATFDGSSEVKNYTEYLVENAKGAIMKWMIEGAKKAYDAQFKYPVPKVISTAIADYKAENDLLQQFIDDECEAGASYKARSQDFYNAFCSYCGTKGIRDIYDIKTFKKLLEDRGYSGTRSSGGMIYRGIKLRDFQIA